MTTRLNKPPIARLEKRLPASDYATLKRGTKLVGSSLSDFVVSATLDAAKRTIEDRKIIRLSAKDQALFAKALLNPPKPNAALRKALAHHQKDVEMV